MHQHVPCFRQCAARSAHQLTGGDPLPNSPAATTASHSENPQTRAGGPVEKTLPNSSPKVALLSRPFGTATFTNPPAGARSRRVRATSLCAIVRVEFARPAAHRGWQSRRPAALWPSVFRRPDTWFDPSPVFHHISYSWRRVDGYCCVASFNNQYFLRQDRQMQVARKKI